MREVYRKSSLERISSPEQLDRMLRVTTTQSWLIFIGVGIIVAAVLMWGFFGELSEEVTVAGVYMHNGEIAVIYAGFNGYVNDYIVSVGDMVNKGDVIAVVSGRGVISGYSGIINELSANVGQQVNEETVLAEIRATKTLTEEMIVLSYMPLSVAELFKEGMEVELAPSSFSQKTYGQMTGRVKSIGGYGVSEARMYRRLGDNLLVQSFRNKAGVEPVIEVIIEVDGNDNLVDDDTAFMGSEKALGLPDLTIMTVRVITRVYNPVEFLLGL